MVAAKDKMENWTVFIIDIFLMMFYNWQILVHVSFTDFEK